MTEEPTPASSAPTEEFGIKLPPNARLSGIAFDDAAHRLRVSFADGGADREVQTDQIVALHGARIRHESVTVSPKKFATPVVSPESLGGGKRLVSSSGDVVQTNEELFFALALRVSGIGELWYLVANSFNFRKALGADATYSTEINFRALVRRLAAAAPRATQDSFFTAILGGLPLPPPVLSLIDFFKTVGKDLT